MRMAAHDDLKTGGYGVEVEFVKVVQNIDDGRAGFDDGGGGELGSAGRFIDVAFDRYDRRDLAQCGQDFRLADIARVNDQPGASERLQRLGAHQAMRIGDDSDLHSFIFSVK